MGEEVIKVEWEQLPQRPIWATLSSSSNANDEDLQAEQRKRKNNARSSLRVANSPAHKQLGGWEYLDHTADIQIHSWGTNLQEAFGACIVGMFAYMVEMKEISDDLEMEIAVEGHDLQSLLFNVLDECLYIFHTESFVVKQIIFKSFDTNNSKLTAVTRGGLFDAARHSQGTEVKAITYSNMQIVDDGVGKAETFVIVDI